MGVLLGLFLIDAHATLTADVCPFALVLFVFHYIDAHDLLSTVDTRHEYIWAGSLVHFNVLSEALCFADLERHAFDRLILAEIGMVLYVLIA